MAAASRKKRIARIGNMSSVEREPELQSSDRIQADCVYEIMESMNKTESNVMSYQQLQDFKSKRNKASENISSQKKSSFSHKQNSFQPSSSQMKKFLPEKSFPLMAKCKKSMTYIKKNLCIPKPRAHLGGFLPKPPQNHVANWKQSGGSKNSKGVGKKPFSKQNDKKRKIPSESNILKKKPKTKPAYSSCSIGGIHIEDLVEKFVNSSSTESENEFEKFLQEHQPDKDISTSDSDSSAVSRKTYKHKIKRKKRSRQLVTRTKITKLTSRKLSDSESSYVGQNEDESQVSNLNLYINDDKIILSENLDQCMTKKFRRIIKNSSDNISDTNDDAGTLNCDSFISSEDDKSNNSINLNFTNSVSENMIVDDEPKNVSEVSNEQSYAASTLTDETGKDMLKCMTPCYVMINQDPVVKHKASSLVNDNVAPVTNSDDDCIIIDENITNSTNQNTGNILCTNTSNDANGILPLELEKIDTSQRNSFQEKSVQFSRSSSNYEASTKISDMQIKSIPLKEMVFGSEGLGNHADANLPDQQISLNSKLKQSLINTLIEKQEYKVECPNSVRKCISVSENSLEKDDCAFVSEAKDCHAENSAENVPKQALLTSKESDISLSCDKPKSDTNECFNVQIVSVKSLNESDVIVLSDDNDDKEGEIVTTLNGTKSSNELAMVELNDEIICLDTSSVIEQKSLNNNVGNVASNETLMVLEKSADNQIESSSSQHVLLNEEEDCVILDDIGLPKEKTITNKKANDEQHNRVKGNLDDLLTIERASNKNDTQIAASASDSNKNSILKIVDSIDFNFIKKFINEINASESGKAKHLDYADNNSIPLCADPSTSVKSDNLFPEKKLKSNENKTSFGKESLTDTNVTLVDSSEVGVEENSLDTNSGDCNESLKLVKNSDEVDIHIFQAERNLDSDIQIIENFEISTSTNASVKCSGVNASHKNYNLLDSEILLVSDKIPFISNKLSHSTKNLQYKQALNSKKVENPIRPASESVPSPGKSSSSTSIDCDNSLKFPTSSMKQSMPTASVCKKETTTSHQSEQKSPYLQNPDLFPEKIEIESISDELDIIAAKSIQNLGEYEQKTILPLLQLYRIEYQKFMEVKCIEQNVSDGLKLLEEKQAKKLMHISASIKNIVKHDTCFHKLTNKVESHQISVQSSPGKKENLDESKDRSEYMVPPSSSINAEVEKVDVDDKVRIFDPSVVEILKSNSIGPSSSQEVYNQLINSVCAECGKHAVAACSGCAKVYYCSEKCGRTHWDKGHYATCR